MQDADAIRVLWGGEAQAGNERVLLGEFVGLVCGRIFVGGVGGGVGGKGTAGPEAVGEDGTEHGGLADGDGDDVFAAGPDGCGFAFLELLGGLVYLEVESRE